MPCWNSCGVERCDGGLALGSTALGSLASGELARGGGPCGVCRGRRRREFAMSPAADIGAGESGAGDRLKHCSYIVGGRYLKELA